MDTSEDMGLLIRDKGQFNTHSRSTSQNISIYIRCKAPLPADDSCTHSGLPYGKGTLSFGNLNLLERATSISVLCSTGRQRCYCTGQVACLFIAQEGNTISKTVSKPALCSGRTQCLYFQRLLSIQSPLKRQSGKKGSQCLTHKIGRNAREPQGVVSQQIQTSFLHYLGFRQFSHQYTIPLFTLINLTGCGWNQIWSICFIWHLKNRATPNKTPNSKMRPTCIINLDHTRVPDSTNQTNAVSHQGPPQKEVAFFLGPCIDLSTQPETFPLALRSFLHKIQMEEG